MLSFQPITQETWALVKTFIDDRVYQLALDPQTSHPVLFREDEGVTRQAFKDALPRFNSNDDVNNHIKETLFQTVVDSYDVNDDFYDLLDWDGRHVHLRSHRGDEGDASWMGAERTQDRSIYAVLGQGPGDQSRARDALRSTSQSLDSSYDEAIASVGIQTSVSDYSRLDATVLSGAHREQSFYEKSAAVSTILEFLEQQGELDPENPNERTHYESLLRSKSESDLNQLLMSGTRVSDIRSYSSYQSPTCCFIYSGTVIGD